jgi:hypothetical protein
MFLGLLVESYTAVSPIAPKLVPLILGTLPLNMTFNKLLQLLKVESLRRFRVGIETVVRFWQSLNASVLITVTVFGIKKLVFNNLGGYNINVVLALLNIIPFSDEKLVLVVLTVIVVKFVQLRNGFPVMVLRVDGIVIDVKLEQPKNTSVLRVIKRDENVMEDKLEHPLNALLSIVEIVDGIIRFVKLEHP